MKISICVFISFLLAFSFPLTTYTQTDSSKFATLYIYHPKDGALGSFKVYLNDSVICKLKYNSSTAIKIYKEEIVELRIKNKKCKTIDLNLKFGEVYYLRCYLDAKDNDFVIMGTNIKPILNLVDPAIGHKEYVSIQNNIERKTLKTLDTIPRRNTIYADIGGQAGLYSLNYDILFRMKKKVKHSFSSGLEIIPVDKYYKVVIAPVSYNFLLGKKNHHLELGLGFTFFFSRYTAPPHSYYYYTNSNSTYGHEVDYILFGSLRIGYRYQKYTSKLFFRIYLSPLTNIVEYFGDIKFKNESQFNQRSSGLTYFDTWGWDYLGGHVLPWAGISIGYSFKNFKKVFGKK